jgi:spore coat-associated protein N
MFNKKIILSILILGTVASMAGAGTFAWFTDSASSNGNSFTAGTLFLNALSAPVVTGNDISGVYPGATGIETWNVQNGGNLDGKLKIGFVVNTAVDHTPESVAIGAVNNDLNAAINVIVTVGGTQIYDGPLSGLQAAFANFNTPLNHGAAATPVILTWKVPTSIDNGIQGDTTSFSTTFTLVQTNA